MIKRLISASFRALGYEIVPRSGIGNSHFAAHLRDLFQKYNINVVLDVGANSGQYRDFLRAQVGFRGYIVSFEPIGQLVKLLRERSTTDKHWDIFPWALGDSNTQAAINITRVTQFSSFLTPENSRFPEVKDMNAVDRQELVEIKRLDSVFDALSRDFPAGSVYLKMDTQGYDLEVIKGASGVLDKITALQTEVSFLPIYLEMPNYLSSITSLTKLGFDVTGMFLIARDEHFRAVEFDCVMLNRQCALAKPSV